MNRPFCSREVVVKTLRLYRTKISLIHHEYTRVYRTKISLIHHEYTRVYRTKLSLSYIMSIHVYTGLKYPSHTS